MVALCFRLCYHGHMPRSIDTHKPGCPCPACTNRGRGETIGINVRFSLDLAAWVREQGGVAYIRALVEQARATSEAPAE